VSAEPQLVHLVASSVRASLWHKTRQEVPDSLPLQVALLDQVKCRWWARVDDDLGVVVELDVLMPAGWGHLTTVSVTWFNEVEREVIVAAVAPKITAPDNVSGLL
jgi:hypothetical protein